MHLANIAKEQGAEVGEGSTGKVGVARDRRSTRALGKGKVSGKEGMEVDRVSIYADFSSFDRSSTRRSSWRIFVLGTREKKKERNKNIAIQVKKLTTKENARFLQYGKKGID